MDLLTITLAVLGIIIIMIGLLDLLKYPTSYWKQTYGTESSVNSEIEVKGLDLSSESDIEEV
jgi:hypothetical protein